MHAEDFGGFPLVQAPAVLPVPQGDRASGQVDGAGIRHAPTVSPRLTAGQEKSERNISPSLTGTVLQVKGRRPMYADSLKALYLLKQNIRALMTLRHIDQPGLAKWVGHSKAWINKFLNDPVAEIQIKDLDKIADALGVATYQLFQPGTVHLTERRSAVDRRSGQERRIGQAGRQLATLQPEHAKLGGSPHAPAVRPSPDDPVIQRMVADFAKRITANFAETRRQTPSARGDVAVASKRDRSPR